MKTFHKTFAAAAVAVLVVAAGTAPAATNYWLPTEYATYNLTNSAFWSLGSPNASDALWITNGPFDTSIGTNTAALVSSDVWVDMRPADAGGFRQFYLNLGSQAWTVTNAMELGHADPFSKGKFIISSGTLAVTNGDGTAVLKVSYGTGTGAMAIAGGTLVVDHLYASNTFAGSGLATIDSGTLITKGNSVMSTNGGTTTFYIGAYAGLRGELDVVGGTNLLNYKALNIGQAGLYGGTAGMATGVVQVIGPTAVLQGNLSTNIQIAVGANSTSLGWLIVSNGGRANIGQLTIGGAGSNNLVLVSGSNSVLAAGGQLYLGNGTGAGNLLRIEGGGRYLAGNQAMYLGANGGQNARIAVDGPGSIMTNFSDMYIGGTYALGGNGTGFVTISNGGVIEANSFVFVGGKAGSYGEVRISGPGSLLQVGYNGLLVGSNSSNLGWNNSPGLVVITDGGTLEPGAKMIAGLLGAITNQGGFFQFTAAAPAVSNQVPGTIVLTNGALSFRAINNAPLAIAGNLTNITYQGNIGFQLNAATNADGLASYTFDNIYTSTNYQRLILTGDNPFWRSAALTIGSGGELIATNSTGASIGAVVTNSGTVRVVNATATFASNVVLNGGGTFGSLASTNNFAGGLLIRNGGIFNVQDASLTTGVISNRGGVFQFSSATPTFTTNAPNTLILTNGVVSFNQIANAPLLIGGSQLTNITYQGLNSYRLNNASNSYVSSYVFDNVGGSSTNWVGLQMINGTSAWQSAALGIGSAGSLLVSNTTANLNGVLTNNGAITVVNASAAYASNVVLSGGTYLSQSATNTFNGGVTVAAGGEISLSNGASIVSVGGGVLTNNGIFDIEGSGIYNPATGTIATGSGVLRVLSGGALNLSNGVFTLANVLTNQGAVNVFQSQATYASNVVLNGGSSYTSTHGTNAFNGGLTILSGAGYNLDPSSTFSAAGGVANNGLFSILSGAAYTFTNGNYFSGNGALLVNPGGRLNLTNGTFAAFGGMGVTNQGVLEIQSGGTLSFATNAAMPQGSGTAQVDRGGILNFTNGLFTFGNTLTNAGTLNVMNSKVTYTAPVVISGLYFSDPSTNTFATNVTVTASGALQGSNGDLFVFGGNLLNQSTNRSGFSLWQAAVLFTNLAAGGTNHTYDVTGSGSANWGTGFTNFDRVSTNFAIGTLSIAPGNRLMITGQVGGGITNAVYVGWLDIQGLGTGSLLTNNLGDVTNTLLLALNLPDINLYYSREDPRNAWLNANIPGTGYNLWGGGLLLPIPEPSAFATIAVGLGLLAFLRRRTG